MNCELSVYYCVGIMIVSVLPGKFIILRTCNALLKRLSRSCHTEVSSHASSIYYSHVVHTWFICLLHAIHWESQYFIPLFPPADHVRFTYSSVTSFLVLWSRADVSGVSLPSFREVSGQSHWKSKSFIFCVTQLLLLPLAMLTSTAAFPGVYRYSGR